MSIKRIKSLGMFLTIGSAMLLLNACGDNVDLTGYDESKTEGSVDLVIVDGMSSVELDSVEVSYVKNGKKFTEYTDSVGSVTITKLPSGTYTLTIKKEGYADIKLPAQMGLAGNTDMPVVMDLDYTLEMHKEVVSVSGSVKLTDLKGETNPQEAVTVQLEYANNPAVGQWAKTIYTTTTGSTGEFTFSNLPEGVSFVVSVRQHEKDGLLFSTASTWNIAALSEGETKKKTAPFIVTVEAPDLLINSTNEDKMDSNTAYVIDFSEAVDQEKLEYGDISVTQGFSTKIAVEATWSNGDKTVSIKPVQGTWAKNNAYTVSLSLTSMSGDDLSTTKTFEVKDKSSVPAAPKGLELYAVNNGFLSPNDSTVTETASSVSVRWNSVKAAEQFEIYVKYPGEANFSLDGTQIATDTTALIYTDGAFSEGTVRVFVQAISQAGASAISDILAIKEGDEIAP
jgi:hypothetical protein